MRDSRALVVVTPSPSRRGELLGRAPSLGRFESHRAGCWNWPTTRIVTKERVRSGFGSGEAPVGSGVPPSGARRSASVVLLAALSGPHLHPSFVERSPDSLVAEAKPFPGGSKRESAPVEASCFIGFHG